MTNSFLFNTDSELAIVNGRNENNNNNNDNLVDVLVWLVKLNLVIRTENSL